MSVDPTAMAEAADAFDWVVALAANYKSKAVAAGFSDYAAEALTVQWHSYFLQKMAGSDAS